MEKIRVCFFISGEQKEVSPGSRLWELPLAGKNGVRHCDSHSGKVKENEGITIGGYFSAALRFLSKKEFSILTTGLEAVVNEPVSTGHIQRVSIFLEKHGAFYHPLKVQVELKTSRICSFVLNGAVSTPGLSLIETEYRLISRLNNVFSHHYLPRVHGVGVVETGDSRVGFFLGEWFEDHKEFHLTEGQAGRQIVIWESDGGCHYLPEKSGLPIYRKIAQILTYYYDIETFEQIFPWHHAAGDFVVRPAAGQFHVKLISVRGYSPLTQFCTGETDKKKHILPSLLVFFLNLSLRIRVDRLDGTGPVVMLRNSVIKATVDGFLIALDQKSCAYDHGDLKRIFIGFFNGFSLDQLMEIMDNSIESMAMSTKENQLIMENKKSHCRILHAIFKTL